MKIAKTCVCCGGANLSRNAAVLAPFVAWRVFGWESAEIDASWGLRDIPQGRAHSICNTLTCGDCGLVFLDMRFDDDEMGALYADYRGEAYTAARVRFEPNYAMRNAVLEDGSIYIPAIEAFLAPHLPAAPRILDWGGDTGINTPFRGRAALHHVFDISARPMVAGAKSVGRDEIANESYDLIVLSNVLEHLPDPAAALAEVVAVARPESLVYVEAPHEDIMRARRENPSLLKRHWHEHINFFTEQSLRVLHERLGLEIIAREEQIVSAAARDIAMVSILSRLKRA